MSYSHTPFIKKIEVEISVKLDEAYLESVYRALMPEVVVKRSTELKVNKEGDKLWLYINGDSISQIRAVINSYLRLIKVANEVLSITTYK
ncbi:MAG: KEOPS complex subunit Pcc1 [Nitrososphaerota archaeon]|nr:KEOPS complex subunit Pcc1 [Nitrososphaerales archaeon]MDW8044534.1 KEOPS complex subunit Pcc1 [Nitrososphaerota archaeon]